MTALRDTPEEAVERKETAVFILGVGIVGFAFLGLVALLSAPHYYGNLIGIELIVAGAIAIAIGILLGVALVAVWLDKAWFGQHNDGS